MTVNPSAIHYCKGSCSCDEGTSRSFVIRRNDTCPHMEIDVKGAGGKPVDLEGWTAEAMLFAITRMSMAVSDTDTTIYLNDVSSVHAGDVIRVESEDAPRELMSVSAVNRVDSSITVSRGHQSTTPQDHAYDSLVYVVKSDEIPVDILIVRSSSVVLNFQVVEILNDDNDQVGDGEATQTSENILKQSKLSVRWRSEDTARAGRYVLQVTLSGPDDERMTLPRNSVGYHITILSDADDKV